MDKKQLTEADVRTKFILPAILGANKEKWDSNTQIREEYHFTKGRVIVRRQPNQGILSSHGTRDWRWCQTLIHRGPSIPLGRIGQHLETKMIKEQLRQASGDVGQNPIETAAVEEFLQTAFEEGFEPGEVSTEEQSLIDKVVSYVETNFSPLTYVLNLALDFTMVAQKIADVDDEILAFRPNFDSDALFARYPRQQAKSPKDPTRAPKSVNTLTLTFPFGKEKKKQHRFGIRRVEEDLCDMFLAADRTGYTGAYIYNTGMWHHHKGLLVDCFRLSESGRYLACQRLISFAFEKLAKNTFYGREEARTRLFEVILREYDRVAADGENAGMLMQGIAYGFFKADRPHLSLIVDKTRTGSAKQRRFGDIDCYYGLDLELSVEVKDQPVVSTNVETEVGRFARDVHRHRVQGIAFVASKDDAAAEWLRQKGVRVQDLNTTLDIVEAWDWRKQDAAAHGVLHFLAHVEHKPEAVTRLLKFIKMKDARHDSLAYLTEEAMEAAAAQEAAS